MIKVFLRFLAFTQRFFISALSFGVVDAIRVHSIYRKRSYEKPVRVWLRPVRRYFYFRGACDRGVLSHFFYPGYHIQDEQSSDKVRYIIDAGANIGDESIRFRFFHPNATVYAVEAERGNFEILKLNTAIDPRIIPVNMGVWGGSCQLEIIQSSSKESTRVREAHSISSSVAVPAVSIGGLLEQFQIPQIDILKLDIEGAERAIFDSEDLEWVYRMKVLIFEPPDGEVPFTTMRIFNRLCQTGLDFNCFVHGENIVLIRSDVDWTLRSCTFAF